MDPLPPAALARCPTALAFFRLRAAPFHLSRQAEEVFWQEFGQQFTVPHPLRPRIALYRLCDSEPKRPSGITRQHMVKESLGPAPVRVACSDGSGYLWAWHWADTLALARGEWDDGGI